MEAPPPNPSPEISPGDWAGTPESVKRLVTQLMGQIESLMGRLEGLEQQQEALTAENQLLSKSR